MPHEIGAALNIDLLSSGHVIRRQGTCAIRTRALKHLHDILQARITSRLTAAREGDVERQVIRVRIGERLSVRDGVGEAVGGACGVAQAGGRVEWLVG